MVPWVVRHAPDRRCIVQAGGNVGAFPLALAKDFNLVVTFEPDPTNYVCLEHNTRRKGIEAHQAALGEKSARCSMVVVDKENCGAHQVKVGKGQIDVCTIDSLDLSACGAIWLDIEGAELAALKGAQATIRKFAPIVITEEKGLGGEPEGAIAAFLATLGYRETSRRFNDRLYART